MPSSWRQPPLAFWHTMSVHAFANGPHSETVPPGHALQTWSLTVLSIWLLN